MSHTAELIAVGTEILLGNIANTDAQMISEKLSALGITVHRHTVVGDNPERLADALETARRRADIIITTGGLGPTYDDLTKQTICRTFGRELELHEDILEEIKKLAADGVVEIMLLGQNVNSYGKNLKTPISFAQLLKEVEKIEGIERIRFMTSHPKDLSDELIQVMKESKKICRHLHLPLQSGSTSVLQAMNRRYTKEQYMALAEKIRHEIPDIAITTDIIVGFPGETIEDIEETIDVVKKVQYDNAFTFIYSKRTGTPAASMPNQVPEEVIKEGFDKLLKTVQETAKARTARLQGQVLPALVEEMNEQDNTLVTGRLSNNTIVHFPGDEALIGRIVDVHLKECRGFYYLGERV